MSPASRTLLVLTAAVSLAACDSADPLGRRESDAYALSAEHLGTVPTRDGHRVSFRYVGRVPFDCPEAGGYGYSTGADDAGRYEIAVSAAEDRACGDGEGTIEVFPLDVAVSEGGEVAFAFERPGDDPLVVTVEVPDAEGGRDPRRTAPPYAASTSSRTRSSAAS